MLYIQPVSKFCQLSLWNIFRIQSFPTTCTAATLASHQYFCLHYCSRLRSILYFAFIPPILFPILQPNFRKTHKSYHFLLKTTQWFCIALSKSHNPLNDLQDPIFSYSLLSLRSYLLSTLCTLWIFPHFSHSFYPFEYAKYTLTFGSWQTLPCAWSILSQMANTLVSFLSLFNCQHLIKASSGHPIPQEILPHLILLHHFWRHFSPSNILNNYLLCLLFIVSSAWNVCSVRTTVWASLGLVRRWKMVLSS